MTNHWNDFQNSDVILIMGSNPASNHPVCFKWIQEAIDKRGAKLICVDPRFTQSAAKSHLYAPLRSGTDIAFLGGMIKYIIDNKLYFEEYVKNYTNASYRVNGDFRMPGELAGLFSGYDPKKRSYNAKAWDFQTEADGNVKKDPTLQDPTCVFQLMKKHYARYTPEMVSQVCGCKPEDFVKAADIITSTYLPDTGTMTLMDIINFLGLATIFVCMIQTVISARFAANDKEFSRLFDKVSFGMITFIYLAINIALPLSAQIR